MAATVRNSPRASAGLSRFAASPCPAAPPAPISVCASSINRIIGFGDATTSLITDFSRSSNSPFTPAPACSNPRSSVLTDTCFSDGGTSPAAMRNANPSTTAVFPTPASPVRIGLFCRRRVRISTICRISKSRPRMGSIFPALACAVRSTVNWFNAGVFGDSTSASDARAAPFPVSSTGFPVPSPSWDVRTNSAISSRNCALGNRSRDGTDSSINPRNESCSSSASSSTADPTCAWLNFSDASVHASCTRSSTWGDSAGVRLFPRLNPSIARVRSRDTSSARTS